MAVGRGWLSGVSTLVGHHVIRASALEAEDVRRVVAQGLELGDGALDHGRRPAAEDVGVGPRRRHRLLDVATSAFFRATQFVSPAAVSAGRHASARSSPATSAVEGAETESYAG